jgi:hypothetical protein
MILAHGSAIGKECGRAFGKALPATSLAPERQKATTDFMLMLCLDSVRYREVLGVVF